MTTQPHPDFAARATELDDEREAINAAVAASARRIDFADGEQIDDLMQRMADHDAAVEELRRRYYPRAHRLVIVDGKAITVSPTGRSLRTVWTRTADTARD